MEERKIIAQKWKKAGIENSLELAKRYYALLSAMNDLKLTEREIQLISFTALRGNISYSDVRDEFCKTYGSSNPTINNMVSKLKKKGILVKDKGKVKVNPSICPRFQTDSIILQIILKNEEFRKTISNDSSRVVSQEAVQEV